MKEMRSRERVMCALARQPMDRVPVNYLANPGIDGRLKAYLGLAAEDGEGLRRALGVDFRGIGAPYTGPKLYEDLPGVVVDDWGIHRRWVDHSSGGYWDFCDFPLTEADEEQVAAWRLPNPDDLDYSGVKALCGEYGDYARYLVCFGDIINGNGMLRGMEQTLVDLITEDPAGLLLADRRIEVQMGIAERILEAANGGIDLFWLGEDLGTQNAPMISMETFRRILRPRYEKMIALAKAYGCKVVIHTCGSSSWAYQEFIEMGIDAVDTLQPECKDMSPRYLSEHFGGRLSFHGCISTAGSVAYGTPEQVRREVAETLAVMMPTNGYMLSPTHELQDNSPTENVLAMYAAARELGLYGA